MIEPQKRQAIYLLHLEGMGIRQIARRLRLSRKAVRRIIREQGQAEAKTRDDKLHIDPDLLTKLHGECEGYAQRVHERLLEEEGIRVGYSTLTRILREMGLGQQKNVRCDRVPDEAGAEMQHDTSVYTLYIGGKRMKVVASSLYLRYSKRRYVRFYPHFDRFRMKCFFHEALSFWGYAAPLCVIDNTNLARLRGTGKSAVMAPEMEHFLLQYGSRFLCHEVKHSDRKAGEERSFRTLETNLFPGRTFASLEDLNAQALEWATVRLWRRPLSRTRLIPAELFERERPYLVKLPSHLPAPYRDHTRRTDQYGFAAFDANFYWVPGKDRADVQILEYADSIEIYQRGKLLIGYELPPYGTREGKFSPKGEPRPRYGPAKRRKPTAEEERRLRAIDEVVASFLDFARPSSPVARHRFVRELFRLSQQLPERLLVSAVARALKYGIRSLDTVRRIALLQLGEGLGLLPHADVDADLETRESYREGRLTDAPDFSAFEDTTQASEGAEDGEVEDDG